ncbi:MAG: sensor histidine kinase [Balneolaceae bacterium]|nr:sensor histidine kinase [Balneolaceae bacterium]
MSRKMVALVVLFIGLASGLVVLTNFSINLISASGSYRVLLGDWSERHERGDVALERYFATGRESHLEEFRRIRAGEQPIEGLINELFRDRPDPQKVYRGFPSGEVYPGELSTLLFAFRHFGNTDPVVELENTWEELMRIDRQKDELAGRVQSGENRPGESVDLQPYAGELDSLNRRANRHEDLLEAELAGISRLLKQYALWFSVITGILLVLIGVVVSVRISKSIAKWEQAMESLKESLREKKVLLSEIHHRVKNNLAVISGLLELESMMGREPENALQESRDRIRSMALIHEQLYSAESFSSIDLGRYARELMEYMEESHLRNGRSKIRLQGEIEEVKVNINQAIPTGLILNELLANAIEHGYDMGEEGRVLIRLGQNGGEVHLSVEDDGKGVEGDFQLEDADSAGFTIIRELVRQLEGEAVTGDRDGFYFQLRYRKNDSRGPAASVLP